MSKKTIFAALAAFALLSTLSAGAAWAAPAPAAAPSPCALALDLPILTAAATTPAPALPAWLDPVASPSPAQTTIFHGYCACECSRIKDCNTNADCSNHRCLKGISCC
ncbi:MAG TPA: hypothetical protein VOA87_01945 [Thermoanaerobaculia bacterium]|nr:hypothetical protein [Thermoanaerobaculia bacterium]